MIEVQVTGLEITKAKDPHEADVRAACKLRGAGIPLIGITGAFEGVKRGTLYWWQNELGGWTFRWKP